MMGVLGVVFLGIGQGRDYLVFSFIVDVLLLVQ